jgi:hypothetical protein
MYFKKENIYFGIAIIILSLIGILCHPFMSRWQSKNYGRSSIPAWIFKWTSGKEKHVGKILSVIVGVIGIIVGILVCLGITW